MKYGMECPVCGHEVDMFDICDNCNYQNSGPDENLDGPTGPNKITLRETKEAYKEDKSSVGKTKQSQQSKNNQNKVDTTDNPEEELTFTGTIEKINGEIALVSIEKGTILKSGSKVEVDLTVANDKTFQISNKVKVGYDGIIRETFPLSINTTFVELIE